MLENVVVLANGDFPTNYKALDILKMAKHVVCCDGAVKNLLKFGIEPLAIIGDMDSLSLTMQERWADRIFKNSNQDSNDLSKSLHWCKFQGAKGVDIVGATGKREDHALGNIFLLLELCKELELRMFTDTGFFSPIYKSTQFKSFCGQQISIFSPNTHAKITTKNLLYPLVAQNLAFLSSGILNESTADNFEITLTDEEKAILVFQTY